MVQRSVATEEEVLPKIDSDDDEFESDDWEGEDFDKDGEPVKKKKKSSEDEEEDDFQMFDAWKELEEYA